MQSTSQTLIGQALNAHGALLEPTPPVGGIAEVEAIAAPIRSAHGVVGAIYAGFSPASAEAAEELGWAAESYGTIAGLCISGDLTMAEVLGSVGFDTLTGCLSYGGVIDVVRAEIQRSLRGGHRLSCCFLDLDGFKRVNDARGHLEGNRVLAAVGQAMRHSARTYDAVGRFGGDEFVVVLPETGAASGARTAQRYRSAALRAIRETTAVPIDASIGIAEWDGEGSAADLLGAADRALAEAKAAGGATVAPVSVERLDDDPPA
jgi:diguanylate cyclase (GGDEF)-like protein